MQENDTKAQEDSATPCPPVASGKLTRRFLLSLEEGLYVVSNVYDGTTRQTAKPAFAEPVAPAEDREAQWQRIKAAYADGRNSDVFRSAEHHIEWKRHWGLPTG